MLGMVWPELAAGADAPLTEDGPDACDVAPA
jgi:hypothetical protein